MGNEMREIKRVAIYVLIGREWMVWNLMITKSAL